MAIKRIAFPNYPSNPVSEATSVGLHEFGDWYHRIDLGDGLVTPGDRNQSLVFSLYADLLPRDLSGCSVLDLGANACGLSIEFAKRGASVVAIEKIRPMSGRAVSSLIISA